MLFLISGLFPDEQAGVIDPRITDDRFILVIDETDAAFDADGVRQLVTQFAVTETEERLSLDEGGW